MRKENCKYLTPFKMCIIDNFPFIEADFDAITNYQLLCKVVEYLNKVIANENEQNKAIEEIQRFLNNLDLQDEVDNKLDEMAESGELQEIMASYLNTKAIFCFDNVANMKNATNLINGSYAKTLGYYSINDGGCSTYKIRTITNDDVVNEENIIALYDDSLIAELIVTDSITPQQFGAYGDNTHDDSDKIEDVLFYAGDKGITINLVGTYYINKPVTFTGFNIVINGNKPQVGTLIQENTDLFCNIRCGDNGYIETNNVANITFNNIGFNGTNKAIVLKSFRNRILNCGFNGFDTAISTEQGANWTGENVISNCGFNNVTHCIVLNNGSDGDINGCLADNKCTTFITGGYDSGYKIQNNHDYSTQGSSLSGYNMTFVGNYIDGFNKLIINGNSGFNISSNTFIGASPVSGENWCIKFTTQTITSGAVTDNIVTTSNNNEVNQYLYFINLTDVSYFSYVTVANNNIKVGKAMFLGVTYTKLANASITGDINIKCDVVNSKATLDHYETTMNNGSFIGYAKFTLDGLTTNEIARWSNMFNDYLHIIKMNNETNPIIELSTSRSIYARGSYAQATSMEVWTIGLQRKGQTPTII